jgi:hypothetical protein
MTTFPKPSGNARASAWPFPLTTLSQSLTCGPFHGHRQRARDERKATLLLGSQAHRLALQLGGRPIRDSVPAQVLAIGLWMVLCRSRRASSARVRLANSPTLVALEWVLTLLAPWLRSRVQSEGHRRPRHWLWMGLGLWWASRS